MNLVRDVLDKQLVDKHGKKVGRVDGLILEIEEGKQPTVTSIELGFVTQCYRLSTWLGRTVERWERPWIAGEPKYRIPWNKVVPTGNDITVDIDPDSFPALAWERWLRTHIIGRIPGA